jgi:glycerol uptake facilitator-like aquaporin
MAIVGRLSWIKLHAFILVQLLGGYLGALLAYGLFKDYFDIVVSVRDVPLENIDDSAAMFNSTPGIISIGSGFVNEIVITAIFMMGVLAARDMWNSRAPRYAHGILIGLVVIGLGLSFGETTGVAINPFRDICPRLAAMSLGWNSASATKGARNHQWWTVGFFAPFIGAMLGSVLYIFVIGSQLQYDDDDAGELLTVEAGPDPVIVKGGQVMPAGDPSQDPYWKSTVFIPKLGPHQYHHTRNTSPYARVHFQHNQ